MRPYFPMTDFEPTTEEHAKLFAESYIAAPHRAQYLALFPGGNALEQLWDNLDPTNMERLTWAEARIGCHHVHLPYVERLSREQQDRLGWDAMLVRHLQEEVEECINGFH